MTRRALFIALLLAGRALCAADEFTERCIEHNESWGKFFRRLFGCRENETDSNACKPSLGETDRKLFKAARRTAAKLFDFKE